MNELITVENEAGERLDKYLSEEFADRSRSFLQKLIKEQSVKVNDKPVKASYRLVLGYEWMAALQSAYSFSSICNLSLISLEQYPSFISCNTSF